MEKYKNQEKVVKVKRVEKCVGQTVCWPKIKVSSTCIGITPVTDPINTSAITIIPTVKRYFYVVPVTINLVNGTTIPANKFYNDDGSPTTEFMSFSPNGYSNLYINAVIQEGGMYVVNTNSLTINPTNAIMYAGTPVILELLTFSANLSS